MIEYIQFFLSVMIWCLYFLTKHPEIQEKVFAELEEVLGDEDIKPQVVSELKLVNCFIQLTNNYKWQ